MSTWKSSLLGLLLCAPAWAQNLLAVPDTRQSTDYSCGAAALQAVLAYYGQEVREDRLMHQLACDPQQGTHPEALLRVARSYGLKAELREGMRLEDLEGLLREGVPTLVCAQAWRGQSQPPWREDWEDGHYMVVIGLDEKRVYLEDPSLLGSRGYIERDEFVERWHDVEANGKRYHQAGLVVWGRPQPPPALLPVE
jgi:predicted double-glycine peptidase